MKNMLSFFFKYKYLLLLILMMSCSQAEDHTEEKKEIDNLITQCFLFSQYLKAKDLATTSQIILAKSEKVNYDRGKSCGYYFMANSLSLVGNFTESNLVIQKALSYKDYLSKDIMQKAATYNLLATNYNSLELTDLSFSYLHRALHMMNNSSLRVDSTAMLRQKIYLKLGKKYSWTPLRDSAYYYLNKAKWTINKFDKSKPAINRAECYIKLGLYHMDTEYKDSSHYYLDQAIIIMHPAKHPNVIYALEAKGYLCASQNKYEKAVEYYQKALRVPNVINPFHMSALYDNISKSYRSLQNDKLTKFYHDKFERLYAKEKLEVAEQRNFVLNQITKQTKKEQDDLSKSKQMWLYGVIGVFLVISLFTIYVLNRSKKINRKQSLLSEQILEEKDSLITQQEKENTLLQLKVNECFESLIQLAKSNSPEFFARFQEVYPEFVDKISAKSPKMRVSELTLCAYIFLGFTIKDIALYTFKSVHTIQGRRSNLRQKFNLSPDESLEVWMKSIIMNSNNEM